MTYKRVKNAKQKKKKRERELQNPVGQMWKRKPE